MPSMLFGLMRDGVPADENVVRSTTAIVEKDAPPAELSSPPDTNETKTDPNPHLGLANRQLSGDWREPEQYSPFWAAAVDNNHNYNDVVNRQVSSSGTAAQREVAGQFGHGTAPASFALEPTGDLRDGGRMGNEYFMAEERPVQSTADASMSIPPGTDSDTRGAVIAAGKENARKAAEAAQYATFYRSIAG